MRPSFEKTVSNHNNEIIYLLSLSHYLMQRLKQYILYIGVIISRGQSKEDRESVRALVPGC